MKCCHFHLKHLGGNATVKVVLIVLFKELTWNVVIVFVNVVRIDFSFSFLLDWTVIGLTEREILFLLIGVNLE